MKRLNPKWQKEVIADIRIHKDKGVELKYITSDNLVAKWLAMKLAELDVIFKVYNLGAGVKKITTNIKNCPICKKELKK